MGLIIPLHKKGDVRNNLIGYVWKKITRILNNRLSFLGRYLWCVYWSSKFLDFRKAFDYMDTNFLWHKIIALGIKGRIFDVIQSTFSVVKSHVQIGAEETDEFECLLGVRQRRISGAFLICHVYEWCSKYSQKQQIWRSHYGPYTNVNNFICRWCSDTVRQATNTERFNHIEWILYKMENDVKQIKQKLLYFS